MFERIFRRPPSRLTAFAWVAALLIALWLAGPQINASLRYERAAVLSGEAWRLVTGHLVHVDAAHLAWNLVGTALVWWLFGAEYTRRGWCLILIASTATIDAGFLLFEPQLAWYAGLSGVLHGCMAAGLVAWLSRRRDPPTVVLAILFAAKLAWEHFAGALPFTAATLSVPVVHAAHTYGAIGGVLAALSLRWRRSRNAAPL